MWYDQCIWQLSTSFTTDVTCSGLLADCANKQCWNEVLVLLLQHVWLCHQRGIGELSRIRWFGHVERKDDNDWVKRLRTWEVEGIRQ